MRESSGKRNCFKKYTNANFLLAIFSGMVYTIEERAGVMELVDVVDSKSTAGDSVPVRVRPPAPSLNSLNLFTVGKMFGLFCFMEEYESFEG